MPSDMRGGHGTSLNTLLTFKNGFKLLQTIEINNLKRRFQKNRK